ncbi:MAG: tetratricopeptide repeat protein [Gammaproteobacteria bacterium]|nr:tetratricopeptide repeat protein [Gammaproteobacteria bacterium]
MTTLDLKQIQISSAIDLFSKGEINQALDAVQDLLKDYPNEPVLFNIKGACYADLGQLDVAVTNYKEAITIKPDYAKAHFNLAGSLHDLGQLETAVKSYQKAIEIDASYTEAYNNLGNVYQELKQVDSAVQSYQKALEIKPDYVAAQYSLGNTFMELGQLEEAVKSYKAALKLKPDFVEAINNLGIAFYKLQQMDDAIRSYERAITLDPDFADAHNNIGIVFSELGQLDEAIMSYKAAITLQFDYAEAHYNLGLIFHDLKRLDEATQSYKTAIAFQSDYADAHYNLGILYHDVGQLKMAIDSIKMAIKINPENADTHKYLGNTFQSNGQIDEAIKCYEKALSINPFHADAHRNLSTIKNYIHDDDQINLMQDLLLNGNLSQSDLVHINFALAKANEDLGKKDDLFKSLNEGNRLRKEELNYSLNKDLDDHSNLKRLINMNPSNSKESVKFKSSKIRPIFIVGMPRSGTSLVEQILSSHQKIHGAGELSTLNNLIVPIISDYILKDKKVTEDSYLSVRNDYLSYISRLNVSETIITDKMPTNFRYIGFILKAFPEAKIIHLNRDSRAICWSIYKSYFPGEGLGWAFNMKDLAGYYNSYIDLMTFWHQLFPRKIYDICYEDLTTNQEEETRKLLKYCELEWDDNCLNFHNNKRAVKTTSSLQVRKKMYQGSSEVWKKYESYLQPLIKVLKN